MTAPNIELIQTSRKDVLPSVQELRFRILREPLGLPMSSSVFAEDEMPSTSHILAYDRERLIGCATLLHTPETQKIQLRGMAVALDYQSQGVGSRILRACHERAIQEGLVLWCYARKTAVGFYEYNGWIKLGDYFEVPQLGLHVVMQFDASSSFPPEGQSHRHEA